MKQSLVNTAHGIRMVVSDVDGTLVTPEKDLTAASRRAIVALHLAALRFTLVSSRPPFGLTSLIRTLKPDGPVAAFNGGLLMTPGGQVLEQHPLSADHSADILAMLAEYRIEAWLYLKDAWLIRDSQQHYARREAYNLQQEPVIQPDFKPYLGDTFKITGVSNDHAAIHHCLQMLGQHFGDELSITSSQPYYVDVTHPLANKGHALQRAAETWKISPAEIAAIGDMPNDLPMFEKAGLSIAMGNADASVKARADCVTASNRNEGFAVAVRQFILHPSPATIGSG